MRYVRSVSLFIAIGVNCVAVVNLFYAPNFEEVEGSIGLGLSMRLRMRLCVTLVRGQELLKFGMGYKYQN